ncbi:MAG TPA: acyl carrier protein [Gammaproteobacteria bacterium]|nr:acyl carrier protein [Gammaproteobacteria bacterium]
MNKTDVFTLVVNHSREVVPELEGHDFQRTDKLSELGANSVDRAEIMMMTMESVSLRVPLLELSGATNIGELADLIYEKLSDA